MLKHSAMNQNYHRGFNDGRAGRSVCYHACGPIPTHDEIQDYMNGYSDGIRLRNADGTSLGFALSEASHACLKRSGAGFTSLG